MEKYIVIDVVLLKLLNYLESVVEFINVVTKYYAKDVKYILTINNYQRNSSVYNVVMYGAHYHHSRGMVDLIIFTTHSKNGKVYRGKIIG
jgi:hypothetical protein